MISISAYENSSTYKFIKDTIEITNPLNKLGITFFIYAELRGDWFISCLANNDRMIRDFINYSGLKYELALSPHKVIKSGLCSISTIVKSREIKNYYESVFISNDAIDEIVYIADHNNIRKVYIFGVSDPLYINKEHLELFILYFNDQASHLISKSESFKIPEEFLEYDISLNVMVKNFIFVQMEENFLNSINAKYYKIKQLQQRYSLSIRETQCLELILQSKTAKEIANVLKLTVRTAETYISNLKRKLHCHSKNDIMVKIFLG